MDLEPLPLGFGGFSLAEWGPIPDVHKPRARREAGGLRKREPLLGTCSLALRIPLCAELEGAALRNAFSTRAPVESTTAGTTSRSQV